MIAISKYIIEHISLRALHSIMKPLSAADKSNILFLLSQGLSYRKVAKKTGFGKSTIASLAQEVDSNKENNPSGRPKKLTTHDQGYFFNDTHWEGFHCDTSYQTHQHHHP
jgi:hypothetical protein